MHSFLETIGYGVIDVATVGRGVRRRIGGEAIRLPARWSRLGPTDCDPTALAVLRAHCRPGSTVLDIGAHLGLFSVAMARLVGSSGKVHSFEPTDRIRAALRDVLRLNHCHDDVEVHREAVGAGSSPVARFYETDDPWSHNNGLIRTSTSSITTVVPTISVDDFVEPSGVSISFLRIAAGGAELDVLRGARRTIAACRPAMLVRPHPRVTRQDGVGLAELWDLLHEYEMTVLCDGRRLNRRAFRRHQDAFNVEVVPNESLAVADSSQS